MQHMTAAAFVEHDSRADYCIQYYWGSRPIHVWRDSAQRNPWENLWEASCKDIRKGK